MMHRFPIRAYTKAQLDAMVNPIAAGQPEAVPWVLYDQATYTDATTTTLNFFSAVQARKEDGNMETASQLPEPQYFQIFGTGLDIAESVLNTAAADATAGRWDDVGQLIMIRNLAVLTISGKTYVQVPLSFLHQSGGLDGRAVGTVTASNVLQYANNGCFDGGYYIGGAVVIPPKQAFVNTLTWVTAVNITGNIRLRSWFQGVLFRRVL